MRAVSAPPHLLPAPCHLWLTMTHGSRRRVPQVQLVDEEALDSMREKPRMTTATKAIGEVWNIGLAWPRL